MFTPWKFFRTPPPTVASPLATSVTSAGAASPSGTSTGQRSNTSRATSTITRLSNLAGTANYLQAVILSLTKGLGVTVNENQRPDLSRALTAIYGSVPPAVSMLMYSNLLDAEFGAQQVTVAAGKDSAIQPNPFQNQAILTINKSVEESLSDQGDFLSQLALMLRGLKTQQIVYTQWQDQLASYPAATGQTGSSTADTVRASSVDMGDDVHNAVNSHIDQMSGTYGSAFNMMAAVSSISNDVVCIVNTFSGLGRAELAQLQSLFSLAQGSTVKESLQDIANGLTSFVFVPMMVQASSMVFSLDRIAQMSLNPLRSMVNPVATGVSTVQKQSATGKLVGVIRQVAQGARLSSGPLAGLIASNTSAASCGVTPAAAQPSPNCFASGIAEGQLSTGMNDLSTLVDFAMQKANEKVASTLNSFTKLMARMQSDTCSQVQLLAMVNNLGTLSSLANAFLTQRQNGSSAAATSQNLLSTIGTILANTQTGNGATYTVQNGVVTVTPPTLPSPTPAAAAVFADAGIKTSLAGISQSL